LKEVLRDTAKLLAIETEHLNSFIVNALCVTEYTVMIIECTLDSVA